MSGKPTVTVLVVDDHFVVRSGLAASLGLEADIKVVGEAECGRDAVEQYRKSSPTVVLMDLRLPDMDGIAAAEKLCAEFPDARVLMFSTFAKDEDIYRAMRVGAKGYLLKTAPRAELLEAVRTVAAGRRWLAPDLAGRLAERLARPELTPREQEIMALIGAGLSNKEIGHRLQIAEDTVKRHVSNLLAKLGVADRAGAVAEAVRRGLLSLE